MYTRYASLDGAVVFVTGGASGIGEEIVRAFAEQGSKVGFVDIDKAKGQALAAEPPGKGTTIRFGARQLRDLTDPPQALPATAG
ncbi:SDR family NAD(P)-dependent oxidoreductase, partial [Nostoc sp. NIES-2111]